MKTKHAHLTIVIVLLICALAACESPAPVKPTQINPTATTAPVKPTVIPSPTPAPVYTPTPEPTAVPTVAQLESYYPTAGWRASTPEEQGMDSVMLSKLVASMPKFYPDYNGVLVARHGYIVLELYRNGAAQDTKHNLDFLTGGVLSALFGIAQKEQKIALDQKMLDYFALNADTNDPRKQNITLENLLSHTSGMDMRLWDYASGPIENAADWALYAVNAPLLEAPGENLDGSYAPSHVLAAVLSKATAADLLDFANARLFQPLGISSAKWGSVPPGVRRGDSDLMLTLRDMAKIVQLYLRNGQWENQSILDADWVKRSTCQEITTQVIDTNEDVMMCYGWYYSDEKTKDRATLPRFWLTGLSGQSMIGIPQLDLVLVTTGQTKTMFDAGMLNMLDLFVAPSVKSDAPLPPNPAAYGQLQENLKQIK